MEERQPSATESKPRNAFGKGGGGLRSKVLRGGVWLTAGNFGEQGLRFARNMILARVLAPEAMGLMAIIMSVSSLFQVLTTVGVKEAIIQSPHGQERTYLNGAWWLSLARSIVLFLAAVLAAPWIAKFYHEPALTDLIRFAFLNVVFQGATSVGLYVAQKQMKFSRSAVVWHGGGAIGIMTSVILALTIKGVWALVIGFVVESAARCLLSYALCPFKPGLQFDRDHFRSLVGFSKGLFGLPALMLVYTEGPVFILGRYCSKEELGVYALTLALARVPTMLGGIMVNLLMPAFAELKNNYTRLNESLLKVTLIIFATFLPALAGIALMGEDLLRLVYGDRYSGAQLILSLLFANEILLTANIPIASAFIALGKPALMRNFALMRALCMVVFLYPLLHTYGIEGAAVAPLIAMFLSYGVQLQRLRVLTGFELKRYGGLILRAALLPLPLVAMWVAFKPSVHLGTRWTALLPLIVGSVIGYALVALWFKRSRRVRGFFWPFEATRRTS